MKVNELISALELKEIFVADPDREIKKGYCGDMLSWVMSRAGQDSAWFTIMCNPNTVAVAVMADVSAVILAEGVLPDAQTAEKAKEQGVTMLSGELPAFELAGRLYELLQQK